VLAEPSDCGDLVFQQVEESASLNEQMAYYNDANFWARNYARETYYESRGRESSFPMPTIPFIGYETPCPYTNGTTCFGPNRTAEGPAWRMDAGPLDSHLHFGMNAPLNDRVTWGETTTCAVVDAQNLTTAPYPGVDRLKGNTPINESYIGILQQFDQDIGHESNLMFEIPLSTQYQRIGYRSQ